MVDIPLSGLNGVPVDCHMSMTVRGNLKVRLMEGRHTSSCDVDGLLGQSAELTRRGVEGARLAGVCPVMAFQLVHYLEHKMM